MTIAFARLRDAGAAASQQTDARRDVPLRTTLAPRSQKVVVIPLALRPSASFEFELVDETGVKLVELRPFVRQGAQRSGHNRQIARYLRSFCVRSASEQRS